LLICRAAAVPHAERLFHARTVPYDGG
jgi:hypothetical protein